jgi:3-phosphoglycerate kinase
MSERSEFNQGIDEIVDRTKSFKGQTVTFYTVGGQRVEGEVEAVFDNVARIGDAIVTGGGAVGEDFFQVFFLGLHYVTGLAPGSPGVAPAV